MNYLVRNKASNCCACKGFNLTGMYKNGEEPIKINSIAVIDYKTIEMSTPCGIRNGEYEEPLRLVLYHDGKILKSIVAWTECDGYINVSFSFLVKELKILGL